MLVGRVERRLRADLLRRGRRRRFRGERQSGAPVGPRAHLPLRRRRQRGAGRDAALLAARPVAGRRLLRHRGSVGRLRRHLADPDQR